MLQEFRNKLKGVTAFILVGIIIIPFALFGVDSLFVSGGSVEEAANVNGESITNQRLQQAVGIRKQQLLSRYQDISPELIDEEQLRPVALKQLVQQKVLKIEAAESGVAIPEKRIHQNLLSTEAFQTNGSFDPERYNFLLRQQGYTANSYNHLLREEMMIEQMVRGVMNTGFATKQEVELLAGVAEQTRDFYYLVIPSEPLMDSVKVEEATISEYYANNQSQFMSEEQVVVEYIDLSVADLLSDVNVDEAVLRDRYESQLNQTQAGQTRRVAHILIEEGNDQAELLLEVQKKLAAGEDFSSLAKQFSMDYGTADSGGDLGYSQKGDLPESFETMLASLEVGEVSAPIEGDTGIHLIKLLDLKAVEVASFEDQRAALEQSARQEMANDLLLERVDELREYSYNAESLSDTAVQLGLEIKQSAPFSRAGGKGIAQFPSVVKASFSEDVLQNGFSSEVIELGEDRVMVLALKEHLPSKVKALQLVAADIESHLKKVEVRNLIESVAKGYEQRAMAGESLESIAKAEGLTWQVSLDTQRIGGNINPEVRQFAFSLRKPSESPTVDGLFLASNDYVLVSLASVEQGDFSGLSAAQRNGLNASTSLAYSSRDLMAYQQILVDEADVEIAQ